MGFCVVFCDESDSFATIMKAYFVILLLACCACKPRLDNSKCQIYISNQLVVLYEEPKNFAQESVKVPTGKYDVLDTQTTEWVDKNQRWLKIQVGKREGWIKDNTWTIEKKSDACK
jgi:hypothetical protein